MLNSFSGIGRLGSDPELRNIDGNMKAEFHININEFFKNRDGELDRKKHWIPCQTHGRLADIVGEFLRKGSQVGIRGSLVRTDENNLCVDVKELEFLSSAKTSETP